MKFQNNFVFMIVWMVCAVFSHKPALAVTFSDPGSVKNNSSVVSLLENLKKVPGVVDSTVRKDENHKYYILVQYHNLRSVLYQKLKIMTSAKNEWQSDWRAPSPGQIVLTSNEPIPQ